MRTTTALAELALGSALSLHARELARAHGVPFSADDVPQDLLVVGMGKLGGGELNVSSDIDLVFVYDRDGTTRASDGQSEVRRPLTNQEFFERLGRRVIAALAEVTADGFVFRVDMRLRPNGDSGPLVVSNDDARGVPGWPGPRVGTVRLAQGPRCVDTGVRSPTRSSRRNALRSRTSCARSFSASTSTTARSPRCGNCMR